jgi:multicomponent Na+:H+ antiporter subunit E
MSTAHAPLPGYAWAVARRSAMFFGFWLLTSGYDTGDLPVGLAASAAATWISLDLVPAGRAQLRLAAFARLATHFVRQSAVAGTEVALRAFNPKLTLRPGFVPCTLRSVNRIARNTFCAMSSLLPGTLPSGFNRNGALMVHCLDVAQPVVTNLERDEALFMRALGHD